MSNVLSGLIVFEGLDGSGTTTQLDLAQRYVAKRYPALTFRASAEPQGEDVSPLPLRRYLRTPPPGLVGTELSRFMTLLFCADRVHHLRNYIEPNTELLELLKDFVLCDRYVLSTLAYQAHQPDLAHRAWVESVLNIFPLPGLTFYLRVTPEQALARVKARAKRLKQHLEIYETRKEQERVFYGYEAYVARNKTSSECIFEPGQVVTIDGSGSKKEVAALVGSALDRYLDLLHRSSRSSD
jgi:dTMP kinase